MPSTSTSPPPSRGYTNCKGQILAPWHLTNDESELASATYSLYTGTTQSINVFFAYLEQKVGLCNVIKTATIWA